MIDGYEKAVIMQKAAAEAKATKLRRLYRFADYYLAVRQDGKQFRIDLAVPVRKPFALVMNGSCPPAPTGALR